MENRRQTYRHSFDPQEAVQAELSVSGQRAALACELLNLSLGGVRVRLRQQPESLRVGDTVVFRLLGRNDPAPVELTSALRSHVVYLRQHGDEWHCGLRFLPSADPRANEQIERALSNFLLAEQRRKRRKQD
jgi:c-di-GMP-binding flagellar brake protein YcgR